MSRRARDDDARTAGRPDPPPDLAPPAVAAPVFEVAVAGAPGGGAARVVRVTCAGPHGGEARTRDFVLRDGTHAAHLDLFAALAREFGTRLPLNRQPPGPAPADTRLTALLTAPLSPRAPLGFGDPAVIRVPGAAGGAPAYYLLATSNDAPDSFPIARSRDLRAWSHAGFVFPRGRKPPWAADGARVSDYWAPEMHRLGGEYRVYFVAREHAGHALAIGVATAPTPEGPFATPDEPLLRGDVIDPHVVVDRAGHAHLLWKEDANGLWPDLLHALLHDRPHLVATLFDEPDDRRTAALAAATWPWARTLEPMERFFVHQTLLEAVVARFAAVRERLRALGARDGDARVRERARRVVGAMRTPILAQRLAPDGRSLVGDRTLVLENDLEWEAHLVEGVWVREHAGRYYLFYAGNDFSTARYGIGVAIADDPLGPYRKLEAPLLRSTAEWWGPGHPSVADGPDGAPWLFLHAFPAGRAGYNEFRALLAAPVAFEPHRVVLR